MAAEARSSWPPAGRSSWSGAARVELTIGQPRRLELRRARRAIVEAILEAGGGYTLTSARGGWAGGREFSAVFSMVGADLEQLAEPLAAAARAGWANGCEAIQVEIWAGSEYRSEDWRSR
jgi:hypothetical protein